MADTTINYSLQRRFAVVISQLVIWTFLCLSLPPCQIWP